MNRYLNKFFGKVDKIKNYWYFKHNIFWILSNSYDSLEIEFKN